MESARIDRAILTDYVRLGPSGIAKMFGCKRGYVIHRAAYLRKLGVAVPYRPAGEHCEKKAPPPPATERACLVCGEPFVSEGIGNRVCKRCKQRDEWRGATLEP